MSRLTRTRPVVQILGDAQSTFVVLARASAPQIGVAVAVGVGVRVGLGVDVRVAVAVGVSASARDARALARTIARSNVGRWLVRLFIANSGKKLVRDSASEARYRTVHSHVNVFSTSHDDSTAGSWCGATKDANKARSLHANAVEVIRKPWGKDHGAIALGAQKVK
jgi:hypothetical protein